jgi:hypothetical protein
MQHDPRNAPSSPAPIEPTGFFTGIKFRPIIGGVIVDTIATYALVTLYFTFFVAKQLGMQGSDPSEDAVAQYWNTSDGLTMSLILGSLGTVIGGFYAAYKAGNLEMKHGALVGIGSIILGLILSGGSANEMPEWFMALSFAAAIPAGAIGGFLAEMFKNAFSLSRSPTGGGLTRP